MRITIQPPLNKVATSSPSLTRTPSGAKFRLPDEAPDVKAQAPTGKLQSAAQAAGLETLLAVQQNGGDERKEKRRRGMQRGRQSLDLLDKLKVSLLEGDVSPATLLRLKTMASEPRLPTDDAGLDDVLDAIDLRTQVELAKFEAHSAV